MRCHLSQFITFLLTPSRSDTATIDFTLGDTTNNLWKIKVEYTF